MPVATCSECYHYVNVPNVDNAQAFECPFCLRDPLTKKKPVMVLYKCHSCMGVSLFAAKRPPSACPRCRTLIRTLVNQQVPSVVAPFVEREWLYHVTSPTVARLVKAGGLRSALARTGVRKPDPEGSFAKDRVKRVSTSIDSRLRQYIANCRANRDSDWFVKQDTAYTPIPLVFTGDNNDYETLKVQDDSRFMAFGKQTIGAGFKGDIGTVKLSRDATTLKYMKDLKALPAHFLTRLANDYANLNFDIEGAITASHVYFLNTTDLMMTKDGFKDYIKFRKPEETAVLRIRRQDVFGLMADEADQRAVRTALSVSAFAGFEVMTAGTRDDFLRDDFRADSDNWTPFKSWV
ncbi:hypothetical protein ACX3YG_28310 [Pseudomonas wadenswilerensis]